jgi:hypothetical protein
MNGTKAGHLLKYIWRGAIAYNCKSVSDEVFRLIRRLGGVEEVHCNINGHDITSVEE